MIRFFVNREQQNYLLVVLRVLFYSPIAHWFLFLLNCVFTQIKNLTTCLPRASGKYLWLWTLLLFLLLFLLPVIQVAPGGVWHLRETGSLIWWGRGHNLVRSDARWMLGFCFGLGIAENRVVNLGMWSGYWGKASNCRNWYNTLRIHHLWLQGRRWFGCVGRLDLTAERGRSGSDWALEWLGAWWAWFLIRQESMEDVVAFLPFRAWVKSGHSDPTEGLRPMVGLAGFKGRQTLISSGFTCSTHHHV